MHLSIKQRSRMSGEYVSQALIDLIQQGIEHGIRSARSGVVTPFVLTAGRDGSPVLTTFPDGSPAERAAQAMDFVAALGADVSMVVFSVHNFFAVPDRDFQLLMVEASERGMPFAVVYGQAFRPGVGGAPPEKVRPLDFMGQAPQRLTD